MEGKKHPLSCRRSPRVLCVWEESRGRERLPLCLWPGGDCEDGGVFVSGPRVAATRSPGAAGARLGLLLSGGRGARGCVIFPVRIPLALKQFRFLFVSVLSEGMILWEKEMTTCEHLRTMRGNPVDDGFSYCVSLRGWRPQDWVAGTVVVASRREKQGRPTGPLCVWEECPQPAL